MSDRLTQKWTKTAAEAFGASGARGEAGERFVAQYCEILMHRYDLYEDHYHNQVAGIDIKVYNDNMSESFTADVKNNIDARGSFCVEIDGSGWLFDPRKISDRIWHCNHTTGMMAWYDRKDMQHFVENTRRLYTFFDKRGRTLAKITPDMGTEFITRTQVS